MKKLMDIENSAGLTLGGLQVAHVVRQEEWCPDQKPGLSFRGNEMAGEVGETIEALYDHIAELGKAAGRSSNVVKKLERERYGWRGSRATKAHLAEELADVVHTAVLCAITSGIDLEAAVIQKFNATSQKNGLATLLPVPPAEGGKPDRASAIVGRPSAASGEAAASEGQNK
ncbi:MazG-like family protein [Aquibium oceanicum]|uniref:NTP pyrophosphohydrolase MazG putative catalytic core domain-containing protein n=1 Tax=Aquibium oceanicum TaxID=1670800 RepID=A0A1L3SPU2_9HYPH|nr:MazG-like family protein [Aquibium oceanicum]APH71436.1 hypothetical protein BSQ44_08690 [Aquibium oceanicum]